MERTKSRVNEENGMRIRQILIESKSAAHVTSIFIVSSWNLFILLDLQLVCFLMEFLIGLLKKETLSY